VVFCKFTITGRAICSQSVFGRWISLTVICVRILSGLVLIIWGWILQNPSCRRSIKNIYWVSGHLLSRHFLFVTISFRMYIKQRTLVLLLTTIWVGVIYGLWGSCWAQKTSDCYPFCCSYVYCCPRYSIFTYCECVYFALGSYSLSKLTVLSTLGWALLTYMVFQLACFMFSLVTGARPLYLLGSLVILLLWENIREQLTQEVHWIQGWFCFGSDNQVKFSSCSLCKVFFVTSGFQAFGPWIFRDHF
jgi:hypothetical protein